MSSETIGYLFNVNVFGVYILFSRRASCFKRNGLDEVRNTRIFPCSMLKRPVGQP